MLLRCTYPTQSLAILAHRAVNFHHSEYVCISLCCGFAKLASRGTSSGWPRFLIPVQIIGWFVIIIDSSNRNHALPPGTRARSVSIACMSIPSLHQSRNPYLDSKRSRDARTRPASVPRSQFVLFSSRIFIVDNYLTIRQYCTGWWSMIGGEGDQEVGASSFLPSFFPSR